MLCKQCKEKKELVILDEFCSARCAGMWASSDECAKEFAAEEYPSLAFCSKVLKAHGERVCQDVMSANKDGSRYRGGMFPIMW